MWRPQRPLLVALVGLLLLAVVLDRFAWASVAIWREDPATNMWLGYTRSIFEMPVGLISSMRIPNPNGLVLASAILSRLPSLWVVSAVLGVLQACLIAWVSWLGTRDLKLALLSAGPLLASITLRGTSVDLWGQWTSIPVNFLLMAGLLIYIRSRSPWGLPLVVLGDRRGTILLFFRDRELPGFRAPDPRSGSSLEATRRLCAPGSRPCWLAAASWSFLSGSPGGHTSAKSLRLCSRVRAPPGVAPRSKDCWRLPGP